MRAVNTTGLIVHWSMEGTMRDLLKRSEPVDEDPAPEAAPPSEQVVEAEVAPVEIVPVETPPEPDYVLVKRPEDDEWRPLVADD